jgi:hypothetical protein
MDDVVRGEAELVRLRERCYAPGASPDTVPAYLAAVERMRLEHPGAVLPADEPTPPGAGGEQRRTGGRRAWVGCLAVALVAVGLGLHATLAPAEPVVRATAAPAPSAAFEPPLPPGDLLATFGSDGAWSTGTIDAGGHEVVVSGLCMGRGTYSVRIGDGAPTELVCRSELPALVMLTSARPLNRFAVTVTPGRDAPRWVFSVGTFVPYGGG